MNEDLASFPADYRQLVQNPPVGWNLASRIVQPEIRLSKKDTEFNALLYGTRTVRGEKRCWPALSLDHNWVADNKTIRPLPHDSPVISREMLGSVAMGKISFSDVIRLLRLENPHIPVFADENIFLSGRNVSGELSTDIEIQGLNATLFPYQAQGVTWMVKTIEHTGGLILADEMGLGKTIQIIALLLGDKPDDSEPALILCPTSLIANWRREIFKFAPELTTLIHRGPHRTGTTTGLQRAQIVLSTYDTVVNDISIFAGMTWGWLICDEAQALKNPESNRRKSASLIPRKRTIPMTGTPVETSLLDLWSLVDLAIPSLLGSRENFEKEFPDSEYSAKELSHLTNPVVLCRKVYDVAGDLPDRIDIDVPLELGERLTDRYYQVLQDTLDQYPVAGNLVATGQLQLFCAHPWLRGGGNVDNIEEAEIVLSADDPLVTPKIERTIAILDEAFRAGKKVLIFTIFNRCNEIIRQATGKHPFDTFWGNINGSTPQQERQAIVDMFMEFDGPGCLILNPKAAGTGLNITCAKIVIHFTQVWNPAIEIQASARAYRRGQTEPVYIYRLFYEDTVERVMIDRSKWRRELGNEAVPVSTRDTDDLKRALSLKPERESN